MENVENPRLTAVVTAYWPERFDNVERIVQDLQSCTRPPDTLIVLNNNPEHRGRFDHLEGVSPIEGTNWECRGKYVAGLLAFADYYLLNDDDITVGPRTIERLLERAHPDFITANRGVVLRSDSYYEGYVYDADTTSNDVLVHGFCGSSLFASHAALVRVLGAEVPLRHKWPTEGDDILAGLANRGKSVIIPMQGAFAWQYLPDWGVAMNLAENYYKMRDEFTIDALRELNQ